MTGLTGRARALVLFAAGGGLLFDGVELGLMPVASLSVSQSLLGPEYTPTLGGDWFARFTAALMLGAAIGGILFGRLGDAVGRTRALAASVLVYSAFAGLGAVVETQEQMLALRFLVGLGVGGVWPNAVALAAECFPGRSRPTVAGLMGAALNAGILLLSQVVRVWHVTPDSWRWVFWLAAAPAALGVAAIFVVPESPEWTASRGKTAATAATPLAVLFRPPVLRVTLVGILLGSIPLVGAWAAAKWAIPWADTVGSATDPGYKATAQGWWATGAVLGSFCGAQVAATLSRRLSYALMSVGATALTLLLFLGTRPLEPTFMPVIFAQSFVATLFFGWLPLYLPEMFPMAVRATGTGIAYNTGRFATAAGVFAAGALYTALDGSYAAVGAVCGLVYLLGVGAIAFIPDTPMLAVSRGRKRLPL
jgi:predicted MFS family arabinose efflux permease